MTRPDIIDTIKDMSGMSDPLILTDAQVMELVAYIDIIEAELRKVIGRCEVNRNDRSPAKAPCNLQPLNKCPDCKRILELLDGAE